MSPPFRRVTSKSVGSALRHPWRIATAMLQSALPPPLPPAAKPAEADTFAAGRLARAGGGLDYKLYVPPDPGTGPRALVVMLHGCEQTPDDFAHVTRMNETAREQGFFVLYPAQSHKANPGRCWNWFRPAHQARGRGEPAMLVALVREVAAHHGIDPRRIYVAGLSAGGAMAAILATLYPDVFAAVGVHSGLPRGAARDLRTALDAMAGRRRPTRPQGRPGRLVPLIVVHGDADRTVHPDNGQALFDAAGQGRPAEESTTAPLPARRGYTRRQRRDAKGRVLAEHWVVHGGTHGWSGGHHQGRFSDPQGPDATDALVRFFQRHALLH